MRRFIKPLFILGALGVGYLTFEGYPPNAAGERFDSRRMTAEEAQCAAIYSEVRKDMRWSGFSEEDIKAEAFARCFRDVR